MPIFIRKIFFLLQSKLAQRSKKSFTLLEVMVAASILSLGAVLIHEAYFLLIDNYEYCSNYFRMSSFADENVWRVQDDLSHFGSLAFINTSGEILSGNKVFNWSLSYALIDQGKDFDLYEINFNMTWQQAKRQAVISRSAYAIYERE